MSVHHWPGPAIGDARLHKEEFQVLMDMILLGRGSLTWLLSCVTSCGGGGAQGYLHRDVQAPHRGISSSTLLLLSE